MPPHAMYGLGCPSYGDSRMPSYPFEDMPGRSAFDQYQSGARDDARARAFSTSFSPGLHGGHTSSARFDNPPFPSSSSPLAGAGWHDEGGRNNWPGGDNLDGIFSRPGMYGPGPSRSRPYEGAFQRFQDDAHSRMYDNFGARPNHSSFETYPSDKFHLPQNCPLRRRQPAEHAGGGFHLPQECPSRRSPRGQYDAIPRHMPYGAPFESTPGHGPHVNSHTGFEDRDREGGIDLDRGMPPEWNGNPWASYERLRPENEQRSREEWTPDMWQSGEEPERTGF